MVEGGRTPLRTAEELEAIGYQLVITPGAMVRALTFAAQDFLKRAEGHRLHRRLSRGACSILTD